jgi:hypothetical protein
MGKYKFCFIAAVASLSLGWAVVRSHEPADSKAARGLDAQASPRGSSPDDADEAKERLEALKKRLPDILTAWVKERVAFTTDDGEPPRCYDGKVKLVRRTSPTTAKFTFAIEHHLFTVTMNYCDGVWTTVGTLQGTANLEREGHYLMLAIDEAGGK